MHVSYLFELQLANITWNVLWFRLCDINNAGLEQHKKTQFQDILCTCGISVISTQKEQENLMQSLKTASVLSGFGESHAGKKWILKQMHYRDNDAVVKMNIWLTAV